MKVRVISSDFQLTPCIQRHIFNKIRKIKNTRTVKNLQISLNGTKHLGFTVKLITRAFGKDQVVHTTGKDIYLSITSCIKKMAKLLNKNKHEKFK